jgi:hypothetical protein
VIERLPPGWRDDVLDVLEAERDRPDPPREVADQLRRDLLARLTSLSAGTSLESVPNPSPAPGRQGGAQRRSAWSWRSRGLRVVPKAAGGSFLGSLLAFTPLALAGLGSAALVGVGSYLAMRSGALRSLSLPWAHSRVQSTRPMALPYAIGATEPFEAPISAPPPSGGEAPTEFSTPQPPLGAVAGMAVHGPAARHAVRRPQAPPSAPPAPAPTLPATPPAPAVAAGNQIPSAFEGRLLEKARQALRTGESATALKDLAEAEKFRSDSLSEEREALTVLALSRSGDAREAQRRMSIFSARYPKSIYLNRLHTEIPAHEDEPR